MPHPAYDPDEEQTDEALIQSIPTSASGSIVNGGVANGNGIAKKKAKGPLLDKVRYIDYRYYRFLLHPDGEFRMVR